MIERQTSKTKKKQAHTLPSDDSERKENARDKNKQQH